MKVKMMRAMPMIMAFCCSSRLKFNCGHFNFEDRRRVVDRRLLLRDVVFLLLVLLLRVIGQMFLARRL